MHQVPPCILTTVEFSKHMIPLYSPRGISNKGCAIKSTVPCITVQPARSIASPTNCRTRRKIIGRSIRLPNSPARYANHTLPITASAVSAWRIVFAVLLLIPNRPRHQDFCAILSTGDIRTESLLERQAPQSFGLHGHDGGMRDSDRQDFAGKFLSRGRAGASALVPEVLHVSYRLSSRE